MKKSKPTAADAGALRPLSELTGAIPTRAVPQRTLLKWITSGVKVNGTTYRLAATRVGGTWMCSADAITAFVARLTAAARGAT